MSLELTSLLIFALGLGMMHALDADHIIAVTGLSAQGTDTNRKSSLIFCLQWAVGHGLSMSFLGAAVFFMGMAIPEQLSGGAEQLVGVVLVLIGLLVLWKLHRKQAHFHFHHHDGLPQHAHWHVHETQSIQENQHHKDRHIHQHTPVLVGLLHGTAGTAPLLALLPLAQLNSPWLGMGYLLLFAFGVFIAMALFGGLMGHMYGRLQKWGDAMIYYLRLMVSFISIGYGSSLILAII